ALALTTNVTLFTTANAWSYVDAGTNLGTAWPLPGFDDSAWLNKTAVFYTDKLHPPPLAKTVLSATPITYYFRAHFTLNAAPSAVALNSTATLDDGGIVYLNGTEALRVGLPVGTITFTTPATRTVTNAFSETLSIPAASIALGNNVLAVEVHQDGLTQNAAFALALNAIVTFTNSPQMAIRLNEILANSHTLTNDNGLISDWVELYNPSAAAVDLTDMSLSTDPLDPRAFVLAPGSTIPAQGYLIIEFNNDVPASPTNTGSKLKSGSDAVYLYERPANGGLLVDSVVFGPQAADYSIGRVPDGAGPWALTVPTRSAANFAAATGNPATLRVNEWLAHSSGDGDWFEIYNPDALPVMLSGLFFSQDTVFKPTQFPIPPLSYIGTGPNGYVQYHADKATIKGANHVNFRLASLGDVIAIVAANGLSVIHSVTYGIQTNHLDISEGFFPDGSANIVVFTDSTSPEDSNFLPIPNALINEALTHTDPPLEDAIELYNPTDAPADLSGWYLSNSHDDLKRYRIANGTIIPANGFVVFYQNQFNGGAGSTVPFTLNAAHGDSIHLSQADGLGNLTGYRASVSFGSAANGVSFGRYQTSVGVQFPAMSQRTFGVDNPASLAAFRLGAGLPNSAPKVGPVVISEIMYHPPSIVGTIDNTQDEFIELYNITGSSVPLFDPANPTNTWQFVDGVTFAFPTNVTLAANGFLMVVPFDPVLDPTALATFRSKYGVATNVPVHGPYAGKLSNLGESLELAKPDPVQLPPHPDAGFVPYIRVDKVTYSPLAPWPLNADAGGASLQRRYPLQYGNDVANWAGIAPSAGRILLPPSITAQPVSLIVTQGNNASFSVTASGEAPLNYQWLLNGSAIAGATNASFAIDGAQAAHAGNYTVLVANPVLTITSSVATLTVRIPPSITQPPLSLIVTQGNNAIFSVTAAGDAPLTYQWLFNGNAMAGASSASFTVVNAQASNAGNYQVKIANAIASMTSAVATLTVRIPPSITQPPVSLVVTQGVNATFSVTATGDPTLTYQWLFNGNAMAGASSPSFTVISAQAANAGNYQVQVANDAGLVTSAGATLTVRIPPALTQPPASLIVTQGANATFSVTASGDSPLTYQWLFNGSAIAGASSPSFTVTSAQAANAGNYQVQVANGVGSITSAVATLTVRIPPAITQQPVSLIVTQGGNATFSVTATGDPTLTFQWLFNGNAITGATGSSLSIGNAQTNHAGLYVVVVSNNSGSVTSAGATLTVLVPPFIVTQPVSLSLPAGATATFSVVAGGDAPLSLRWRFNGNPIAGATAGNLILNNVQTANEGAYDVVVFNNSGSVTSLVATLRLAVPPSILTPPVSLVVTQGSTATLSVTAAGDQPLSYQWRFNGTTPLAGATNAVLTIPNVQPVHSGTYAVLVSNSVGAVTSAVATLTVLVPPTIIQGTLSLTVTQGNTAVFSVTASGVPAPSLQWRFNGVALPGETSSTLTIINAQAGNAGNYQIVAANTAGVVTSAVMTLAVRVPPAIVAPPASLTVTQGASAVFTVSAAGDAPLTFQWRFNGNLLAAATNAALTIPNAQPANAGSYTVQVSNGLGTVTST
ncbi:MAG TPA: immunoglobulin domain-containing protein, partial [Verrucomicrobiae bacterium]